ncbi:MAG: sulfurtransferase [Nitrososphaerales archaeon]
MSGKPKNYKGYSEPSLVVSVEQASKLVGKRDVIFIDTRNYWKYVKGHIPGAFNLELYAFHWVDTSMEGINAFAKQMQTLFRSIGLEPRKQVIFYQNNSGYDAARGVWLLNYLGHKKASLLDGGLNLWRRKHSLLSTKDPGPPKNPSKFIARLDDSIVATLNSLSQGVKDKSLQILDTRNAGEYSGTFQRAFKAGHIPGAINREWKLGLRRDGTLKDASQLRKIYSSLAKDGTTVTYCQSGYRAAHSWLALKLIGFEDAKNYLGSWYEWGNREDAPVER